MNPDNLELDCNINEIKLSLQVQKYLCHGDSSSTRNWKAVIDQ